MCAECGCYGSVNPYGVGGREVNSMPPKANLKKVTVQPGVYHENDTEIEDD
jgi:hypothetical protein